MAAKTFEMIRPGDARYAALERVAARHGMSPDDWQRNAHLIDEEMDVRRGREREMRQVPRYREEAA